MLALGGAAVLLLGVFLPLVSLPVVGTRNYIQNGTGDGIIILILAGIAAFAVVTKAFRCVWVCGLASLALLAFTFTKLQVRLAEARDALADNPFKGLGEAAINSIQLQWAWPVLILGAVLVVTGAIIAETHRYPKQRAAIMIWGTASMPLTLLTSGFLTWTVPIAIQRAEENAAARRAEQEAAERRAAREAADKAAKEAADRLTAERMATNQIVVRRLPANRQQADLYPEWPDAAINAFRQGDILLSLMGLAVKDKQLQIRLLVENTSRAQQRIFQPWSLGLAETNPRLTDDLGTSCRLVPRAARAAGAVAIPPGKTYEDLLNFQTPSEKASYLRLELPAAAFEGTGQLRMHLPEQMVFLALAPLRGIKAVPKLVQALKDEDPKVRLAAVTVLAEIGPEARAAIPALVNGFGDSDKGVRDQCVLALTRFGAASYPALRGALKQPGETVRVMALSTIIELGAPAKEFLADIVDVLKDPAPAVRAKAASVLGTMANDAKDALPVLAERINDSDLKVRLEAIQAVTKVGPSEGTMPALIEALQEDNEDVSRSALTALARIGPCGPASVPVLQKASTNPKARVRIYAASALGSMGPNAKAAIPDLQGLLQDTDNEVRKHATEALAKVDSNTESAGLLLASLLDNNPEVARGAIKALDKIARLSPKDVPALIDALKSKDSVVRAFATSAIEKIGPDAKKAVPVLIEALNDTDSKIRYGAISALTEIGPGAWSAAPALSKLLRDSDIGMVKLAIAALGAIGPDARPAVPDLIRALSDPKISDDSFQALVKIGRGAVPDLVTALDDKKDYARRLKVIAALGNMGPEAKDAIGALTVLTSREEKQISIRNAAKEALGKIKP
jgi:HEAT repeat protein